MRTVDQSIPSGRTPARPSAPSTPPNAFSSEFLADVRGQDESLTASEAELAGPWKLEPLPGHPGAVAVLRVCESLAEGDEPEAVFLEEETARICVAILPGVEREPLYHLAEEGDEGGLMPGGFPMVGTFGEQGPRVRGWFRRYHPEIVRDIGAVELHDLERLADALLLHEHRPADRERLLQLRGRADLDDLEPRQGDDAYSAAIGRRCSWISRQIACGVAGMSSWRTPRPASASIRALITAAGEATEPASPQPFTPIGLFLHGTSTVETCMDGMSAACGMA